ncbi:nucleotidyltransferase domain-containing protein [Microvirga arsenatis]|uniref:Nucleotidyltransferase n=1 Tax=Microvirga arsenatis TaxID=2692265 RepID=A0ABW9Z4H6_9HYPH|nr:nucleotidyltransferase [Microvirga arsenatis]NBJ11261.1 nucleotidyltransferase [Microvirga arsenatis]NBJ25534.1 nucleotidyltransferase [Microvirga arsenatis]
MAVPEPQLETWSHQGAIAQSRDTYVTVKSVLEDVNSAYFVKNFHIRLQGSYANDTNVFRDSDVDIIIRLDSTFYHDAPTLPADQYRIFERKYPGTAHYGLPEFKKEVADWLRQKFGRIDVGQKAIFIPGDGRRRDCDVLPCARFKYYYRVTEEDESFADGICFFLRDGTRIVNFPVQHSDNCTAKHQATNSWFKPTVRLYKNMRNYLIERSIIPDGIAPSYFIEGMLWNVPSEKFGTSFENTFVETFTYIINADRSLFKCANGIHPLLGNTPVNWSAGNCQAYLNALRHLWNNWPNL